MFCDAYSIPKKSFVKIRIHYYNVLGSLLLPDLGSLPKTHILCSSCHKVLGSFINHVDIEGGGGLPNIYWGSQICLHAKFVGRRDYLSWRERYFQKKSLPVKKNHYRFFKKSLPNFQKITSVPMILRKNHY